MLAGITVPVRAGPMPLAISPRSEPLLRCRQRPEQGGLQVVPGRRRHLRPGVGAPGGPAGQTLRGEEFKRARDYIRDAFGEPHESEELRMLRRRLTAPTNCSWCEVQEQRTAALAGHEGGEYQSPPQEREQALQLVELVLGQKVTVNGERERCWRQPIAGGQRSVTLRRAASATPTRGAPVPGSPPTVRTPRKEVHIGNSLRTGCRSAAAGAAAAPRRPTGRADPRADPSGLPRPRRAVDRRRARRGQDQDPDPPDRVAARAGARRAARDPRGHLQRPRRLRAAAETGRAAGRQPAAQVSAATFHSVCARLLRDHAQLFGRAANWTVYDQVEVRKVVDWLLSDRQRTEIQQALADFGQPAVERGAARDLAGQEPAAHPGKLRAGRAASGRRR